MADHPTKRTTTTGMTTLECPKCGATKEVGPGQTMSCYQCSGAGTPMRQFEGETPVGSGQQQA